MEAQQFNLQNTGSAPGREGNVSFCLEHHICLPHQEMLLSVNPIAEGIIIAKHSLCCFGKKNQDCHRTLQLHLSSSRLCLGISANWGWAGHCGCGLHQEMLLRVSKNQDIGSPGAWKGEQWEGSSTCPKERSKHKDQSLKGYFLPFPYHFQGKKKGHKKEYTRSKPRGAQP